MSNKGGSIRQRLREQPPPRCRRAAPSPSFTPLCLAVGAAAGCQGALGSALRGAGVAFNREGQRRAPPPQPPGSVESPSTCRRRRISLLPPRGLVRSRPSTSSRAGALLCAGRSSDLERAPRSWSSSSRRTRRSRGVAAPRSATRTPRRAPCSSLSLARRAAAARPPQATTSPSHHDGVLLSGIEDGIHELRVRAALVQ
ncbi:uncharacterized protein LOC144934353 isoform X1 [Lampetra fluviatilis]